MLSVAEALDRVLAHVPVLSHESVPLAQTLGRVLAESVVAGREIPPWDNSSMDGYAVRAEDTQAASETRAVTLAVVGEVAAGTVAKQDLAPGQAFRILTGAPLPPGSNAVVPQEEVRRDGARLLLVRAVRHGAYVRPRVRTSVRATGLLEPGTVLRPAALGVLASLGRSRVDVYRRPVVAVLSTGDELVAPDAPLGPGQIPDSNTYTLCALAAEAGAVPLSLGIARDHREELVERLRKGLEADVLVSSAGVSVGDRDFVREAIEALGAASRLLEGQHASRQAAHLRGGASAPVLRPPGEPGVLHGHLRTLRSSGPPADGGPPGRRPAASPGARARDDRQPRKPARIPPGSPRTGRDRSRSPANRRAGIGDFEVHAPARTAWQSCPADTRIPPDGMVEVILLMSDSPVSTSPLRMFRVELTLLLAL